MTFEDICTKRISYILAIYNHAERLESTLERMKEIKTADDELLIMDGGSTDATPQIIEQYKDIIDIYSSEKDSFPAQADINPLGGKNRNDPMNAINKGILLSSGKYIKTISDDDIYHPDAMKQAIAVLEAHPEIDLLMCGGVRENLRGKKEIVYIPPDTNYGKTIYDIFYYGRGCGVGHFFKRKAIAIAGLHPYMVSDGKLNIIIVNDAEYVVQFIIAGLCVRFCRINLFFRPWSHPQLRIQKMKTDYYWKHAARRYTSFPFYLRFTIAQYLKNYTILSQLFFKKYRVDKKTIVWDGGLS